MILPPTSTMTCLGCGTQAPDSRGISHGWCIRCPPKPLPDGAWRTDEAFSTWHPIAKNACWWRHLLHPLEVVKYTPIEPDRTDAVNIDLVGEDGRDRPLRSDEIVRLAVVYETHWHHEWCDVPTGLLPAVPVIVLEALAEKAPTDDPRWRQLTRQGEHQHPYPTERQRPDYNGGGVSAQTVWWPK